MLIMQKCFKIIIRIEQKRKRVAKGKKSGDNDNKILITQMKPKKAN